MSLLLVGIGVALLTVPAAAVHSSVGAALTVRTASTAIVAGFSAVLAGLVLAAVPLLIRLHDGQASMEHQGAIDHLSPVGLGGWLAAAALAAWGTALAARSMLRSGRARRRARIPSWAHSQSTSALHGCDVVVADRRERFAFAVPGTEPQIVLSRGLVDALSATEAHAVACHEAAHIRLGHHRHLAVFNTYLVLWGVVPGASTVAARLRRAVEEWADDVATQGLGADPVALCSALDSLGSNRLARPAQAGARSARRDGVAITGMILTLVVAAVYVASHTAGEVAGVVAALH